MSLVRAIREVNEVLDAAKKLKTSWQGIETVPLAQLILLARLVHIAEKAADRYGCQKSE